MAETSSRAFDFKESAALHESKNAGSDFAQSKNPQYVELLNQEPASLQNWASSNVWRPIANTLIVEPHNAISSTLNDVSKAFGGSALMDDWKKYEIPTAKTNADWLAQNLSGGLAMVIPYGIAAIASKGALNPLASKFSPETAAAKFLASNSAALITGATIYDGLKKPEHNQTRIGNALGAAAGFSVFEAGTILGRGSSGATLAFMRAVTGGLGAAAQVSTSDYLSTGQLPTQDRLLQAAAQGAILNPVLGKGFDMISPQARATALHSELSGSKLIPLETAPARTIRTEPAALPELKLVETKSETFVTGMPVEGQFKNYGDYQNRGWRFPRVESKVFETSTGARIIYPTAESTYGRITLEQTNQVLHSLPDNHLVKKLEVSDYPHPDQVWFRQQKKDPSFTIAAELLPDGTVRLYRPTESGAYDRITHEWGHLLEQKSPQASAAFDKVDSLETFTSGSNSHIEGKAEFWPVLTETLLAKDNVLASATALANPLRSAVWSKAFLEHLGSLRPQERSTMHDFFMKRAELIKNLSTNRAQELLNTSKSADALAVREYLK